MAKLSINEAVIYALEHMPGDLTSVWTGTDLAHVHLKDAGGVYTVSVYPVERNRLKDIVSLQRSKRWAELERMGKL